VQPESLQTGLINASPSTDVIPPTSTITSPTTGSTVQSGEPVTLAGTATDTGGGVVGAVEISVDGGVTWHPATGRSTWQYIWTPGFGGSVTIKVRAVDDSGNLETPGPGISVTVDGPAIPLGTSLWSSSNVPLVISDPDAFAMELGVKFRSDIDGYITGLQFYKSVENTGTHVGSLWSRSGVLLASVTFDYETASGWQQVSFPNPVAIKANATYIASYFTTSGHYSVTEGYFASSGVDNPPLHVLAEGVDGSNGLYKSGTSGFPTQSYKSSNYWVGVFFSTDVPPDTTPPEVSAVSPLAGASNVSIMTNLSVTFNEAIDPATISSAVFELRDATSTLIPCQVSYNAATRIAIITPADQLRNSTIYTVTVKGGINGVKDLSGYTMAADYVWSFTTAAAPPPLAEEGAGGPILVIASSAYPFSRYYAEILRNEGLNAFVVKDLALITSETLAGYDVIVLGEIPLTSGQVTMLTNWVNAGGNLISMRPDKKLASLLGLTYNSSMLSDSYLLINTSSGPGQGLVSETIQFHGNADLYSVTDASIVASLYSTSTLPTQNPAVTVRTAGSGRAAAFTYDLAKSVVYTRQGNPAWAGQERDGYQPIRSNDLFFPDWVDLTKVAIPQADEQQRLLANLIIQMNLEKKPLPRFWYFPRSLEAVVIMTGDDHGGGGTAARFNNFITQSPSNCVVENWECIRGTSYVEGGILFDSQALTYNNAGFEIGLHVNTECIDWVPSQLETFYSDQLNLFSSSYPSLPSPVTERTHCIVWSDYTTQPQVELNHGIRLDTNYYYWPESWINNRPGFFTGSGMPMRFAKSDGTPIDVFQAATQMTDESGQAYPFTINALLDKAIGPEGYYGAFVANMHNDTSSSSGADAIIASAQARQIPIISARQMLTWLDGRNNSTFSTMTWNGSTLNFTVSVGQNANGLMVMVPIGGGSSLSSIAYNGVPTLYSVGVVKGVQYAFLNASSGIYQATFSNDTIAPVINEVVPQNNASGVSTSIKVTATFSEAIDPTTITSSSFELRDASNNVVPSQLIYDSNSKTVTLDPAGHLLCLTKYTATVKGGTNGVKDFAGNPIATDLSWSFTTTELSSFTLWNDDAVPALFSVIDPNGDAIELGVKFRSDTDGYITGLRFYKSPQNTGTHIGNLWTSSGNLLGSTTFINETEYGWQEVNLQTPIPIVANTTYVASYHTDTGHYSADLAYFATSSFVNPPLRALANGIDGGNGVYRYGSSGFPYQTYNSNNYWVDIVFVSNSLTLASVFPAAGSSGASVMNATATFSQPMDSSSINGSTFELRDPSGTLVLATITYDGSTRTAILAPTVPLSPSVTYTATVKGGIGGVRDLAGDTLTNDFSWSFTTGSQEFTIWNDAVTPSTVTVAESRAVELGVKFRSASDGYVTGLRFYKGPQNTGTHIGNLWTSTGNLLASVTFTYETASGWQEASLPTPVPVTANTTYVASYHTDVGYYSVNSAYFASSGFTNPPLTALANGVEGGNGVYRYGATAFPNQSYNSTNYWVDVVFEPMQ
jgi:hypothetical protein